MSKDLERPQPTPESVALFQHMLDEHDLVGQVRKISWRVARSMPDIADDIAGKTLLKSWEGLGYFNPAADESISLENNLLKWVRGILRNTFFDEMRAQDRKPTVQLSIAYHQLTRPNPENMAILKDDISYCLAAVPPNSRRTMELSLAGYSRDEISVICGIPRNTVQSQCMRINRAIRSILPKLYPETARSA